MEAAADAAAANSSSSESLPPFWSVSQINTKRDPALVL